MERERCKAVGRQHIAAKGLRMRRLENREAVGVCIDAEKERTRSDPYMCRRIVTNVYRLGAVRMIGLNPVID